MNTLEELKILKNRKQFEKLNKKLIVYKITNLINNKCYIGITSRIQRRIYEHIKYSELESHKLCCYLHSAIKKYGLKNFIFEIIDNCDTNELLSEKEIFYIKNFNSNNSNFGYNLTSGGDRGIPNDITILKKIKSSHKVKVAKYDLDGNFIEKYESIKQAERENNIPDTDIHRCHKKKWSRNGFMYRKFLVEPEIKIEPFINKRGINLIKDGFQGKNKIKCKLINKKTNQIIFECDSILELSKVSGFCTGQLNKIYKHPNHKKWLLIKI